MGGNAAEAVFPERRASRRQFDRAAANFATASFIHDEARKRLLERLPYFLLDIGNALDLGSGLGTGAAELVQRYPSARVIALDSSRAMLEASRERVAGAHAVCGEAEALPLEDRSMDLILANMLLPWCIPQRFFSEAARVLRPDGLLLFSTLGPDSLQELRNAWARADNRVHVHGFLDMHDVGDMAARAGLEEPVMDVDRIEVTYPGLPALARDIRACGAVNAAAGRHRGLTGRGRWQTFERALRMSAAGSLHVTVELVLGHAFGGTGRRGEVEGGEIRVPAGSIRLRR